MPVARYFLFVGGVLLALLFFVDAGSPKLPVTDTTTTAIDLTAQRIRSDQKWPERIVFDTSLPTIVPPQAAKTEASVPAPTNIAEFSAKARVRETFAQFRPADEKKPEAKLPPKRKVARNHETARNHAAPPMVMAQQPRFGWFDNTW
jgi:hypothetical protein